MKGLVSTPDHGARTAGAGPGTVALNSRTTGRSRLRRTLPAGESVSFVAPAARVRYGCADERPCAEASRSGSCRAGPPLRGTGRRWVPAVLSGTAGVGSAFMSRAAGRLRTC